jgi:hypothetical protein
MSAHTPGPWRVARLRSGAWAVVDRGTRDIVPSIFTQRDGGEDEANARLIAAAPDLLAALKYLLELGGDDDRRITADAAIAKAEGK